MRKLAFVLVLAVLSTAASCNKGKNELPPNTPPQVQVTVRATQFGESLRVVNAKLPSMECPAGAQASLQNPCIGKDEAADIYKALEEIGAAGKNELTAALKLVEAATTAAERKSGLEKVAAIAQALSLRLDQVSIRPLNPTMRATLVTMLATASNILLTLTLF